MTAASSLAAPSGTEVEPSAPGTPEVASVAPPRAVRASELKLKVTGKNFASGVKVAFSNPGIRVLETRAAKRTELVARIRIAPDAPTGTSNLFVVNPDDSEAEVAFEVVDGQAAPSADGHGARSAGAAAQRFEVYSLGDATTILQTPGKAKGVLIVGGGKLKYEEGGKEVFSASPGDIQEIDINSYFGVKTPVFHIILNSGKILNFVTPSLQMSDSQSLVDSLRRALRSRADLGKVR
jgi:hypothetical protein